MYSSTPYTLSAMRACQFQHDACGMTGQPREDMDPPADRNDNQRDLHPTIVMRASGAREQPIALVGAIRGPAPAHVTSMEELRKRGAENRD